MSTKKVMFHEIIILLQDKQYYLEKKLKCEYRRIKYKSYLLSHRTYKIILFDL